MKKIMFRKGAYIADLGAMVVTGEIFLTILSFCRFLFTVGQLCRIL
jgi:hypothetical protein